MQKVVLYWFYYWCRDGRCDSDMTTDGLNIRYRVSFNGATKEFHKKSDVAKWLDSHGAMIGEEVCLQPPIS